MAEIIIRFDAARVFIMCSKLVSLSANFQLCSVVTNKCFSKCVKTILQTCETICEQVKQRKQGHLLNLLLNYWKHLMSFWQHSPKVGNFNVCVKYKGLLLSK